MIRTQCLLALLLLPTLASCSAAATSNPPPTIALPPVYTQSSTPADRPSPTFNVACPGNVPSDPPWVCREVYVSPVPCPAGQSHPPDDPVSCLLSTPTSAPTFTPFASPSPRPPYVAVPFPSAATPMPLPPEVCPPSLAEVQPPDFDDITYAEPYIDLTPYYLEYLNSGGAAAQLPKRYRADYIMDLTGDGTAELVFQWGGVTILGCSAGKYVPLLDIPDPVSFEPASIHLIRDANRNGVPELVVQMEAATQGGRTFSAFEWAYGQFQPLLGDSSNAPFQPQSGGNYYQSAVVEPRFVDIDADGHLELVFHSGIPVWDVYASGLPWRQQDDVFEWDGSRYVPYETRLSPPEYRFQAVQDGDRHTLFRDYEEAITSYQDAIFSDKLKWWTPELKQVLFDSYWQEQATGVPLPTPTIPDPLEYPYLAAYARFRLMIIYAALGYDNDATTVLNGLVDAFPSPNAGNAFVLAAQAFMDDFVISRDMANACREAVRVASPYQDQILNYLGSARHGWQSQYYRLDYTCPIGSIVSPVPTH